MESTTDRRVDPAALYGDPHWVLSDSDLSAQEKLEVLRRWEFDVRERMVAEEENMGGGSVGPLLQQIRSALHRLGEPVHSGTSPAKQGGG